MSAVKKVINMNYLTVEEAKNLLFVPDTEKYTGYKLYENVGGKIIAYDDYKLVFLDVPFAGPTLPHVKHAGTADVGPKRPGGTFVFPKTNDPEFERKKDAFSQFDMMFRAAGLYAQIREKDFKEKEMGSLTENQKKITINKLLTCGARKHKEILVKDDFGPEGGTKKTDVWEIYPMVFDKGVITNYYMKDLVQALIASGFEQADIAPLLGKFSMCLKRYASETELVTGEKIFILSPKVITAAERPAEEPKEGDKKKKKVEKSSHFIMAEMTPAKISPRKADEPHMRSTEDKKFIDGYDLANPPRKFGVMVDLAYIDNEGQIIKPIRASGGFFNWYDTTEEIRKGTSPEAMRNKEWIILEAEKDVKASDYPLPFLNRPSKPAESEKDPIVGNEKIRAIVTIKGSSVGYGSGSLKTHYVIGYGEPICVLPFKMEGGSNTTTIFGTLDLSLKNKKIVDGANFGDDDATNAPDDFVPTS